MNKELKILIVIITILTIFACTEKKNPVGFQSGPQPVEITFDSLNFQNTISFEDSTRAYISNSKVILGNFESQGNIKQTRTLIRFINLPDTIAVLDSPVEIKLHIEENNEFTDYSSIQFGSLQQYWKESYATWFEATDSTSWISETGFSENDYIPFEVDSLKSTEDSLMIYLPENMLIDWAENDSLNYGFVMFTDSPGFIEFVSAESDSLSISFTYKSNADNEDFTEYKNNATSDTFIYENDLIYEQFENELILSNIYPVRMYTKFSLDDSLFINYPNSKIYNHTDFNRMTINKAELILEYSDENNYPLIEYSTVTPYLVTGDTLNFGNTETPLIGEDDYLYLYDGISSDSVNADYFSIEITNIIQSLTSEEYDNKGILLKSVYENKDFFNVKFIPGNYPDISLRPKLRVIYTPPHLDE